MRVLWATTAIAVCLAIVTAAPAHGAVSFYLGGSPSASSSFNYSNGAGLNLTATGHKTSSASTKLASRGFLGLGVISGFLDNPQIDGSSGDDYLRLAFNHVVKLLSITFTYVDRDDDFDLTIDGAQVINDKDIASSGYPSGPTWTVPVNQTGKTFDIGADGKWDDFLVKRIKVEGCGKPGGNDVVPEPTTLFIWSLFGLGVILWRRRRTNA